MSYKTNYSYSEGNAKFTINYHGQVFIGTAKCHPEDIDFESARVGLTIAESRANIQVLRHIRDCELKPQLKILNHLYMNMKTSKYYNPKSYEAKMIRNQIHALEKDLAAIHNQIIDEQTFSKDYISGKDRLYRKLRDKNQ